MYMSNDFAGICQASDRPVKVIRGCLNGKVSPLWQPNGKACRLLAQAASADDPDLELDEVGVLRSIAMTLTYPERGESRPLIPPFIPLTNIVEAPYSIAYLQGLLQREPNAYPGA